MVTANRARNVLEEHFLCPDTGVPLVILGPLSDDAGFFRFHDTVCWGRTSHGYRSEKADAELYDAAADLRVGAKSLCLPFDPSEVVRNLRGEKYAAGFGDDQRSLIGRLLRRCYYMLRPMLPVHVRKHIQRLYLNDWSSIAFPSWPVDFTVEHLMNGLLALTMKTAGVSSVPFVWFWPKGYRACVVMTHDVETAEGRDCCSRLMDMDESYGLRSSFQIVPEERYEVPTGYLDNMRGRGFEVNIHGLNHDGRLFADKAEFSRRAKCINNYAHAFGAKGFRSPVLYRRQEWFGELSFVYDMSVPNVGHIDPQRGGCCTARPFFIGDLVELPLTTIQDYALFHFLGDYSIELWKKQTAAIVKENGLVSFNIHPDYIFSSPALEVYQSLLGMLAELRSSGDIWFAQPGEVAQWWKEREKMCVALQDGEWRITGENAERAVLANAQLDGARLVYDYS